MAEQRLEPESEPTTSSRAIAYRWKRPFEVDEDTELGRESGDRSQAETVTAHQPFTLPDDVQVQRRIAMGTLPVRIYFAYTPDFTPLWGFETLQVTMDDMPTLDYLLELVNGVAQVTEHLSSVYNMKLLEDVELVMVKLRLPQDRFLEDVTDVRSSRGKGVDIWAKYRDLIAERPQRFTGQSRIPAVILQMHSDEAKGVPIPYRRE